MNKNISKTALSFSKTIRARVGFVGLIAILLFGNLAYMNLRPVDPILPGWEEYDQARFKELRASGQPLLVEVYASWCPTCLAQHRSFEKLIEEGRQPNVRAVRVDFDRDIMFREANGLNYTGILILYREGREVARASGLTDPDKIEIFLASHGIQSIKS